MILALPLIMFSLELVGAALISGRHTSRTVKKLKKGNLIFNKKKNYN